MGKKTCNDCNGFNTCEEYCWKFGFDVHSTDEECELFEEEVKESTKNEPKYDTKFQD
jgi:hypothetical protein